MSSPNPRAEQMLTTLSNVRTSPKWSFRGRHDSNRGSNSPGPGAYQAGLDGRHNRSSAWGFGSSTRGGGNGSTNPGPGSYDPEKPRSEPKWSLGARHGDSLGVRSTTPGPGTYVPAYNGASPPNYGFGSSTRDGLKASNTPGPGSYNYDHNADLESAPKYGMGTAARSTKYSSNSPGPGTYNLQDGTPGPKFSMTARRESRSRNASPGPGTYNLQDGTPGPKYSMRPRTGGSGTGSGTPGPGTYNGDVSPARNASPKYGFGTSTRPPLRQSDGAAPGSYNPTDPNHVSPKWGMGTSPQRGQLATGSNPGPGTYNLQDGTPGPKYSMGGRPEGTGRSNSPGPGAYDPSNPNFVSAKWGMGTSQRSKDYTSNSPGPGHYKTQQGLGGPSYTMRGRSASRSGQGNGNLGPTISQFGY